MDKPYTNHQILNSFVRIFPADTDDKELYWHVDEYNRIITILKGDWFLQYDNQIPIELEQNKSYLIKKESYHRLIKGIDELIIKIEEY